MFPQIFIDLLTEAFVYYQTITLAKLQEDLATTTDAETQAKIQELINVLTNMTVSRWAMNLVLPTIEQQLSAKRRGEVSDAITALESEQQPA